MVSFKSSLSRCTAGTRWSSSGRCDHTPPFLQEAARCQLSASSSTSRSGPTSSVYADTLVRGLLGGRKLRFLFFPPSWYGEPKIEPDSCAYERYSDLTAKNDGWMDVRTVHGCFLTADRTGFGLVPCLLPLLLPSCFVLPGFALGLVLPMGNQLVYLFGDAGCGLVTGCQNSRGWSRTPPHHCLGSVFEWLLLTSSPLRFFAVRFNSCVQSSIASCRCDCCLASSL